MATVAVIYRGEWVCLVGLAACLLTRFNLDKLVHHCMRTILPPYELRRISVTSLWST
eukprot:jgi/Phyca11/507821/fgenesh2_kg.PHYCAscaffold_30_\